MKFILPVTKLMPVTPKICSFAISLPVYQFFDYELEQSCPAVPGSRFNLPFGKGYKLGILISCREKSDHPERKLKQIRQPLDAAPLLSNHLMQLAAWVADYYCQPQGEVLLQFLPRLARQKKPLVETRVRIWKATRPDTDLLASIQRKAPRQFELLTALMASTQGLNALELKQLQQNWRPIVKALEIRGLVESGYQERFLVDDNEHSPAFSLTQDQQKICMQLKSRSGKFLVHLLQGVTGSGKTEVYLELMQHVIQQGKQVIYLVPEIGLTPQLLQRLQRRLGQNVVSSHSGLSALQRYQNWDRFKRGAASVVIGTRSAIFSASHDLGLIIIDEEHDASLRQQDGVRYHARDVAIKRAQMLNIPVVLGSATPSLESLHNVSKPHYHLYRLDQRVNHSSPPAIELLDCSRITLNTGCSPQLLKAVETHLNAQGQVLLFLNRRGFAPVVMCHDCGWQSCCHQCDARMTLHQSVNTLICHHCGFSVMVPAKCPQCGARDIRHYGVGTQQLEAFISRQFPSVPVIRIDRDSVKSSKQFELKMKPVREGVPCILVGTQMLAKGHDYPNITLVGLIDTDQALHSSFYRASERLVQTVLQVSGRAGRSGKKGQALLQTAFPAHPLMLDLCRKSYSGLVDDIFRERQLVGFPPFARVVTFLVDAIELDFAIQKLELIKQALLTVSGAKVTVIGPIPALMTRRIGRYRAQLSIMSKETMAIRQTLQQLMPKIQAIKNTPKSRLTIDVDPLDL